MARVCAAAPKGKYVQFACKCVTNEDKMKTEAVRRRVHIMSVSHTTVTWLMMAGYHIASKPKDNTRVIWGVMLCQLVK